MMKTTLMTKIKSMIMSTIGLSYFWVGVVLAQTGGSSGGAGSAPQGSIGEVAENIQSSFGALAQVIVGGSYIGGFGFVLGSIFKFKAHKDNPTQIPIGTPIALLFIGAAMIFLPQIFTIAGTTMFGSEGQVGTIEGTTTFNGFGN